MKFKDIAEAFNHYRTQTLEQIETRAAAIKTEIGTNSNADIDALNIELEGLSQAKANLAEKRSGENMNPITGMSFQPAAHQPEGDILASREYRSAFHKFMCDQPLTSAESGVMERAREAITAEKRDAFISTTNAAAVIPTTMLNEIIQYATKQGGILPFVRRFDLPANVSVPVATPSDMAEWHTEGEEVDAEDVKTNKVTFAGHELMKVFSISAAARSMSLAGFESYLQQELSRTMVTALEYAAINGTGSGQPLGLLANGVIKNIVDGSTPANIYSDCVKAVAKLKRGYGAGAVWAMNYATLYNKIAAVMTATGEPLFNTPKESATAVILGRSVVVDDFLPDDAILFGNFQYYAMNYPQSIMLEVSRDSSFRRGLIDYRAMAVADGKPIIGEAFVRIDLA